MALNLISMFIHWLRQILRIGPKEESPDEALRKRDQVVVTPPPEEASVEILNREEEPIGIPNPEEKAIAQEKKDVQKEQAIGAKPAEASAKAMQPSEEEPPSISVSEGKGAVAVQIEGEVAQQEMEGGTESEEPSIKTAQQEEKLPDIFEPGKKITVSAKYEEEGENGAKSEAFTETGQPEDKPTGILEPEEKVIRDTWYEEAAGEKEDGGKFKKPYAKKAPTEERREKRVKPPATERKPSIPEEREPIFLGDLPKTRRRLTKGREKSQGGQVAERETIDEETEGERASTVVESPFVEIDLDNANVCLVLPQQELKSDLPIGKSLINYVIDLNGKSVEVPTSLKTDRAGRQAPQEKRILLEEPLGRFQVAFPSELQGRKYDYRHKSSEVYTFIAVGNNRGRFFYLNDKDGNVNVLPGRETWILVHEDFELQTEPEVIEEKRIWEEYQPLRVNLGEIDGLIVKNKKSGEQKKFFSELTFRVEGEKLVEDDFKKECPLFAGEVIRIVAPHENQSGWNVWTLHKEAGAQLVCEDWTGRDCLALKLPEQLPCEFGEFQIDICERNKRVPEETLFFRLMPPIELGYPKALIIPNPETGHAPSAVSIKIDSDEEWKLNPKEEGQFESTGDNSYQIEVPPEKDTARFSVAISGRPESAVNFRITIPRLKWRTSSQKDWQSKLERIDRKDLEPGEPFHFLVRTNDFENKYDFLAVLEANGRKVQEGKFVRKGVEYWLELNEFFDTIKQNKRELTLRIEIRKARESRLLGGIEAVHFEAETKIPEKAEYQKPKEEEYGKISPVQAVVWRHGKVSEKRGKGFSKEEIMGAGMGVRDVRLFNIPYDKRRKSSHSRNINELKILKGRRVMKGGDEHAA